MDFVSAGIFGGFFICSVRFKYLDDYSFSGRDYLEEVYKLGSFFVWKSRLKRARISWGSGDILLFSGLWERYYLYFRKIKHLEMSFYRHFDFHFLGERHFTKLLNSWSSFDGILPWMFEVNTCKITSLTIRGLFYLFNPSKNFFFMN